jgi:peptidase M50-like protein
LRVVLEAVGLAAWVLMVVSPCHTLLHELSHGVVAKAAGARGVAVQVGAGPPRVSFTIGGLSFRLSLWPPWAGVTTWEQDIGSRAGVVVAAAGPIASLLMAAGLVAAAASLDGWTRELPLTAAIYAFWGFVFTAIPWTYPAWWRPFRGSPSDGYLIYETLRGRRRAH